MSAEVLREAAVRIRHDCDFDQQHGDPAFLEAVADWLDAEAASLNAMAVFTGVAATIEHEVDIRGAALTVRKDEKGAISLTADTSRPAIAVARAYLGRTS